MIPLKEEGIGGWKQAQRQGDFTYNSIVSGIRGDANFNFGDQMMQGVFKMTELCAFMGQQLLTTPPLLLHFTESQSIRTLSSLSRLAPHSSFLVASSSSD